MPSSLSYSPEFWDSLAEKVYETVRHRFKLEAQTQPWPTMRAQDIFKAVVIEVYQEAVLDVQSSFEAAAQARDHALKKASLALRKP